MYLKKLNNNWNLYLEDENLCKKYFKKYEKNNELKKE